MNIDIFNALNDVYDVCTMLENFSLLEEVDYTLKEIVEYDICLFIEKISLNHKEERLYYFNQMYLDGKEVNKVNIKSPITSISIPFFVLYDLKNKTNTYKLVENLFMVIGKHFMLSQTDKKDIDKERVIAYIKELNHYAIHIHYEKENAIEKKQKFQIKEKSLQEF